jgi:sigma54-dependent transcription regulator
LIELEIPGVTDHNQIYVELKNYCDRLNNADNRSYTAAISSGTPDMQVCWILLAEYGDFSKSNPFNS